MKRLMTPVPICAMVVFVAAVAAEDLDARWVKLAFVIGLLLALLKIIIAAAEVFPIVGRSLAILASPACKIYCKLRQAAKRVYIIDVLRRKELLDPKLARFGSSRTIVDYFCVQLLHADTWGPLLMLVALVPLTYLNAKTRLFDYMFIPVGFVIVTFVRRAAIGTWMAIACALAMGYGRFGSSSSMWMYIPAFSLVGPIAIRLAKVLRCKPGAGKPWAITDFAVVSFLAISLGGLILIATGTLLSFFKYESYDAPFWLVEVRMIYKSVPGVLLASLLYDAVMQLVTGNHVFTWKRALEKEHER